MQLTLDVGRDEQKTTPTTVLVVGRYTVVDLTVYDYTDPESTLTTTVEATVEACERDP